MRISDWSSDVCSSDLRDAAGYNSGFLFANQGTDAMDFQFTDEQLMIQDVARRIAQEKIAPTAADFDRSGQFPLENIPLLGYNGLMGIVVPHEHGGAGLDSIGCVLAMIEIAAAHCTHSTIMSANNTLYCHVLLHSLARQNTHMT